MSKEQMMQEFVSSAITPLLERVVVKKLIQSFDVIAEQQKAELSAAKARIAELEADKQRILNTAVEMFTPNCDDHTGEKTPPFSDWQAKYGGKCVVCLVDRIAELEKALEPFADLVTAWSGHSEGLIDQLVLVNREDARRAAALLKEPTND